MALPPPSTIAEAVFEHIPPRFLVWALAAHTIAALTLTFIPKPDLGARYTALALIASFCLRAIAAHPSISDNAQFYKEYMVGFVLHAHCFLCLLKLSAPKGRHNTTWRRLKWSVGTLFTPRRGLPKNSKWRANPPDLPTFVASRTLQALLLSAIYHRITAHPLSNLSLRPTDIAPHRDSMLPQLLHNSLTAHQLHLRAEEALLSLARPALIISIHHCLVSALAVLLFPHSTTPADWPPLFGSPTQAWSLGRFYSAVWGRLMRKAFTMNAAFVTGTVLRMRLRTARARCAIVLGAFVLSGGMHVLAGWRAGGCGNGAVFWTFVAEGCVVLVERGLVAGYVRVVHSRKRRGLGWRWKRWEMWGWRGVGYVWVVMWQLELAPWSLRGALRCEGDVLFPGRWPLLE